MTPFETMCLALDDHGRSVNIDDSGKSAMAQCPAHDDRRPSLKIDDDDGTVLFHCHAGCAPADVLFAIGLTFADLSSNGNGGRKIAATYLYVDEQGVLLFEVVRYAPKGFAQRRPDKDGAHVWKLGDVRRVLYRLPQLVTGVAAGQRIFVVEGEKDVEALEAVGEVATCNPGGAGKWRTEYSKSLKGATVTIVADRDPAGRDHALKVVRSLCGAAASVEVVEAAEGKDAADHLAAGHGVEGFVPVDLERKPETEAEPDHDITGKLAADIDDWRPTDTYNSELLVAAHGRDLLHAAGLGWLCWDDRRWRRDDTGEAARRAKQTAIAQRKHAVETFGGAATAMGDWATQSLPALALRQFDWSITSEQARRIEACLSLTATHETVAIRADDLDSHPDLLCVANGTLDLDTYELRPQRRDDRITRVCAAAYRPDAEAPGWLRFLDRVQPDADERAYLQRRLGSALSGHRLDHVLSVFYGEGRNGKSVFVDVIRAVLGDYAMESAEKLLVTSHHGRSAGDESGDRAARRAPAGHHERAGVRRPPRRAAGEEADRRPADAREADAPGPLRVRPDRDPRARHEPQAEDRGHRLRHLVAGPPHAPGRCSSHRTSATPGSPAGSSTPRATACSRGWWRATAPTASADSPRQRRSPRRPTHTAPSRTLWAGGSTTAATSYRPPRRPRRPCAQATRRGASSRGRGRSTGSASPTRCEATSAPKRGPSASASGRASVSAETPKTQYPRAIPVVG